MRGPARFVAALAVLAVLAPGIAGGCFGPRLFFGIEPGPAATALAEIAMLYVKEKTGVESVRVELSTGEGAAAMAGKRVDLAVAGEGLAGAGVLLQLEGIAVLAAGHRPREELQFTTVVPALRKLAGLLRPGDLQAVIKAIDAGRPPAAAARNLLQERRWI